MRNPRPKILLVEDDLLVGLYLEDLLDGWDCEAVGPMASAPEAEVAASAGQFQFALLDVNIIGGTSFGAAEILSARGIPFVFLTAYGATAVREDLRGNVVLSKPIKVPALEQVLRTAGLL